MRGTKIVDLRGNIITSDITKDPIIVIETSSPRNFLDFVSELEEGYVWKVNMTNVSSLLASFGFSKPSYLPFGHIILPKNKFPEKVRILLGLRDAASLPVDYVIVSESKGGKIWKPIPQTGFSHLGFLLSKEKPNQDDVCVVNANYVSTFSDDESLHGHHKAMNPYNLLGVRGAGNVTLKKQNIISSVVLTESSRPWYAKYKWIPTKSLNAADDHSIGAQQIMIPLVTLLLVFVFILFLRFCIAQTNQ